VAQDRDAGVLGLLLGLLLLMRLLLRHLELVLQRAEILCGVDCALVGFGS
jgi:hypothetical protein